MAGTIFDEQGGCCRKCRAILFTFEVDHRVPLALGGTNERRNLEALCVPCHRAKTVVDVKRIAKAKRLASKHGTDPNARPRKAKRPIQSRPFPQGAHPGTTEAGPTTDPTDELPQRARADLEVWIKSFDLRRPFDPDEHPKITELRERYKNLRAALSQHEADKREIERKDAALRGMVYETTSLSAQEDDGSHWCKISAAALTKARQALTPKDPQP